MRPNSFYMCEFSWLGAERELEEGLTLERGLQRRTTPESEQWDNRAKMNWQEERGKKVEAQAKASML